MKTLLTLLSILLWVFPGYTREPLALEGYPKIREVYAQQMQVSPPESYAASAGLQHFLGGQELYESPTRSVAGTPSETGSTAGTPSETGSRLLLQNLVVQDVSHHRLLMIWDSQARLRALREAAKRIDPSILGQQLREVMREEEKDEWRRRLSETLSR